MQTSKVFIDLVQGFALKHTHYSQFSNFASTRPAGKEKKRSNYRNLPVKEWVAASALAMPPTRCILKAMRIAAFR